MFKSMASRSSQSRLLSLAVFCVCFLLYSPGQIYAQTSLSTPLASATNADLGVMFEVHARNSIIVDDFDVNFGFPAIPGFPPLSASFEVWTLNTAGSFVGQETNSAAWTLVGTSGTLTSLGAGFATPLGLNLGVTIPAGQTQAFYIVDSTVSLGLNLTPGVSIGNVGASDANIDVLEGTALASKFGSPSSPFGFSGVVHYTPAPPAFTDDVAIELLSPLNDSLGCEPRTAFEQVMIELRNTGANPIPVGTVLTVNLSVDGGPLVTEFVPVSNASVPTGGILPHTFTATADLSAIGPHTVQVSVTYFADLDASNDIATQQIQSGGQLRVTSFPYLETFSFAPGAGLNDLPVGFVNDPTDAAGVNADWLIRDDATPTPNTGPSAGNSTGVAGSGDGFAYLEDAGDHASILLRSPCFDLGVLSNPRASFALFSNNTSGGADNNFSVDVITYPGGTLTADVVGPIMSLGAGWMNQVIDLSPFAGQVIQLVFRGDTSLSGAGETHDIAIDDLAVFDLVPTPGQAPQPGLAVFEINQSLNANAEPVGMNPGGPFFSTVTQGQFAELKMEGQPLQAIVLFSGMLNPGAAVYNGIGNIDCGGVFDPAIGLPLGLTVQADGGAPGFLNSFFVTGTNGVANFRATIPPTMPVGVLATFQCAFRTTSSPGVALSNAVQLTIQ